jgi:hypothetical protein
VIKIFIVTYNNPEDLNSNVDSLLCSDILDYPHEIYIINNHSNFELLFKVTGVLHNNVRPDFSTGHLARNWNQAIINGFGSLSSPQSDVVVAVQDDVLFKPQWASYILEQHKTYSFITAGVGDAFCSYTPEAIKKIGLWDERFCNIGYQEADYFLRALIYNKDKSSINDIAHNRTLNELPYNFFYGTFDVRGHGGNDSIATVPPRNKKRHENHLKSANNYHKISGYVYETKWGTETPERDWTPEYINETHPTKPKILNYIYYPYFECDIENLKEKNYAVRD